MSRETAVMSTAFLSGTYADLIRDTYGQNISDFVLSDILQDMSSFTTAAIESEETGKSISVYVGLRSTGTFVISDPDACLATVIDRMDRIDRASKPHSWYSIRYIPELGGWQDFTPVSY